MLECRAVVKELYDQAVRHTRTKRAFLYNGISSNSSTSSSTDLWPPGSTLSTADCNPDSWSNASTTALTTTSARATNALIEGGSSSVATQRVWKSVVQPRKSSKASSGNSDKLKQQKHSEHSRTLNATDRGLLLDNNDDAAAAAAVAVAVAVATPGNKTRSDSNSKINLSSSSSSSSSKSRRRRKKATSVSSSSDDTDASTPPRRSRSALDDNDRNNRTQSKQPHLLPNNFTNSGNNNSSVLSTLQPVRTLRGDVATSVTDIILSRAASNNGNKNKSYRSNHKNNVTEASASGASHGLTKRHLANLIQLNQDHTVPTKLNPDFALGATEEKPSVHAHSTNKQHRKQRQSTDFVAGPSSLAPPHGSLTLPAAQTTSRRRRSDKNDDAALTSLQLTKPVEAFQTTLLRGPHGVLSVRLPTGSSGSKSACELLFRPQQPNNKQEHK
jgi:hypothetical protein